VDLCSASASVGVEVRSPHKGVDLCRVEEGADLRSASASVGAEVRSLPKGAGLGSPVREGACVGRDDASQC
jgi:hypothetical protein